MHAYVCMCAHFHVRSASINKCVYEQWRVVFLQSSQRSSHRRVETVFGRHGKRKRARSSCAEITSYCASYCVTKHRKCSLAFRKYFSRHVGSDRRQKYAEIGIKARGTRCECSGRCSSLARRLRCAWWAYIRVESRVVSSHGWLLDRHFFAPDATRLFVFGDRIKI